MQDDVLYSVLFAHQLESSLPLRAELVGENVHTPRQRRIDGLSSYQSGPLDPFWAFDANAVEQQAHISGNRITIVRLLCIFRLRFVHE